MIRILLKCVQQRNEYEQEINKTTDNDALNKKREEIQKLKRQLLDSQSTLRIPSSIEWLSISNMDCKIDISHCTKIMGIQLNNVRVKQITFPLYHVIPCIALSIDHKQILYDWQLYLNLSFSNYVLPVDNVAKMIADEHNNNNNGGQSIFTRPPVRFLFFNGKYKPELQIPLHPNINNNRKHIQVMNILRETNGIIPTMVLILKQIRMSERQYLLKERQRNKYNKSSSSPSSTNKKKINDNVNAPPNHVLLKGDTNRDQDYLCIYLDENERNDLFIKLATFSLHLLYDQDPKWIQLLHQRIDLLNIWWTNHDSALWIKQFGQNVEMNKC